jgi:hypothetical protein
MGEKLTICLIGPHKGGKSSVLATLTDCVKQGVHGYPPQMRPSLQTISADDFHDASGVATRDILGAESGLYEALRRDFAEGISATDTLETYGYFFRLDLSGRHPRVDPARLPIMMQVIDAAGEIAIPQGGASVPDNVRGQFSAQIVSADALIFCVPLVNLENTDWITLLSDLIDRLAAMPDKKLKRAVVAFTQYERLFVRLGPSAFTYACDPRVALYIVRDSLAATPWLEGLRALERHNIQVRFTVTSAYGFSRKFHNPNIDPHSQGEERRFRRDGIATSRALNEFWRPFLTAEPVLYASLGEDSAFTFSYDDIDGLPRADQSGNGSAVAETDAAAMRTQSPRRKRSFWQLIKTSLDVNREE